MCHQQQISISHQSRQTKAKSRFSGLRLLS